jgi:hypothetical protein
MQKSETILTGNLSDALSELIFVCSCMQKTHSISINGNGYFITAAVFTRRKCFHTEIDLFSTVFFANMLHCYPVS